MTSTVAGLTSNLRARIAEAETRMDEIERLMSQPEIATDSSQLIELGREQSSLGPVVERGRALAVVERQIQENRAFLAEDDADMRDLAQEELDSLDVQHRRLTEELTELLRPRDPNDERNVIIEIRAGTGGDEASLFAGDLLRAYLRYAETRGWKTEILSSSESGVGGFTKRSSRSPAAAPTAA